MLATAVELPYEAIVDFCDRWKIQEFALFGSVLREDFRPDSDIDVLVVFEPEAEWTLLGHVRMEVELGKILGREVDLLEREAIEQSHNWIRRKEILTTARTFYAKR